MASTILQHAQFSTGLSSSHTASKKHARTQIPECLLWLGISFLLMLFLTRSSFLYPYNNWDDSNSYFSMGKSMFHGTLIYRDLFDQKGPYLYFLYGLCSLVSRTTFTGVFILEVIWGMFDLLLLRRIMSLFCSRRVSIVLTPILFTCMCASKSFYWGGCAEEICLPFLLLTFCLLLRALTASAGIFTPHNVFLAGLCCGFVFCVKFTLMGFFLGFAIIVILSCRSFREFLRLAGWFLLGVSIPFVPWLLYFAIRGGLDDWYRVYIYTNVFQYSNFGANSHGDSAATRIYDLTKVLYWLILDNIQYFLFIIIGILWFLFRPSYRQQRHSGSASSAAFQSQMLPGHQNNNADGRSISSMHDRRQSILLRVAPLLLFALTFLFIFIGGIHLPYYSLPLTVFAVTGMAAIGQLVDWVCQTLGKKLSRSTSNTVRDAAMDSSATTRSCNKNTVRDISATTRGCSKTSEENRLSAPLLAIGLIISIALSFLVYWNCSWNRDYLFYDKSDVFLSRFTDDINRDRASGIVDPENTTLLNVGCLDCGLYTTADIYPTCYWFQSQTLPGDEVANAQDSYMENGDTDYVVVRGNIPEAIHARYEEIDSFHQKMGQYEFEYYLFRKRK